MNVRILKFSKWLADTCGGGVAVARQSEVCRCWVAYRKSLCAFKSSVCFWSSLCGNFVVCDVRLAMLSLLNRWIAT
ncbi:MAG: hypothetical protein ACKERG_01130 [Candidatus Hodgkinia cicadicola]